ncbi:MAG TPA: DUF3857 domain-containing protein, partial [Candidatus Acidoferrales bacterium]
MRIRSYLAALGLLCVAVPLSAQEPAQSAPDHSQEPFVIEQFRIRMAFEADGRSRREQSMRVRVQSDAGVKALGQLVFGYNSANERLDIEYIRVRKPDGGVITATASNVQDLTSPVAREAPIYTDARQKHVTVPGLRPGDILEYSIVNVLHTPLAPGHFWYDHIFSDQVIILDEELLVYVPREKTLKLKTQPGFDPTETGLENEYKYYRWKHSNLQRRAEEDEDESPRRRRERRKPGEPSVELTTFQSWEEVGQWYAALERDRIRPSDEIRAKAAELTRGLTGDIRKIQAIYDYVAQNFRYVSLSLGLARYQPHSAAEVFANQYGDCKDKHTLLAALLDAAGLRAWPALIHTSRKIDADLPSPAQFDHVISAIPMGDEMIWVDTTTEIAPFRLLAASLRNKKALLIPGEASAHLVDTPADPPFPSMHRVEVEGEVNDVGKLSAKVRYTLRGDTELVLRVAFRRTPQNQWKQLGQILAIADGMRGEVTDITISDLGATGEPFRVEYAVGMANFLDWSSKRTQLGLPMPAIGMPGADADAGEGEEHPEPIELGTPLEVHIALRLTLPSRYTVRAPVPVGVPRDYAEYRSRYTVEGNVVVAERRLNFVKHELPAARARDYLAFVRAVRADEAQALALQTTAPADAASLPETVKADDLYQAGIAAFNNGDYRAAVQLFRRVTEKEPQHQYAWNNLGRAHLALREFDAAVQAIRKQTEVNPFDEFAWNNLGRALWLQQKYDEAETAFRKQIEVNPLDRFAHANLGAMYREQRKYAEAVDSLERAVAIAPDNAVLHVNLGQAYLNLKEADKALAAFDRAVEISPSPTVWNNIAYELSLHNAHLDRAERYAESAVGTTVATLRHATLERATMNDMALVTSIAAYWDTLGWIRFQRGDLDGAESYIRAAWLLDLHGEVGDHLGQIREKRGQKELAARTYALALLATRPPPETRDRLAALVGADKVDSEIDKARKEAADLRVISLGKLLD